MQWIRHFLTDRTQQVLLEGTHSSTCAVDSGGPQGTVLGPLLFLAFINDPPESVTSNARLFADDCLLYRVVNTNANQLQLQEDLHQLDKWGKNLGKCHSMQISALHSIFQRNGNQQNATIYCITKCLK